MHLIIVVWFCHVIASRFSTSTDAHVYSCTVCNYDINYIKTRDKLLHIFSTSVQFTKAGVGGGSVISTHDFKFVFAEVSHRF